MKAAASSSTKEAMTNARQVPAEKARKILSDVTRKDSRTGEMYLQTIASDRGLINLLKKSRHPLVLFYPGIRTGKAHIVFPPSPFVSRRGYQQLITDVAHYWETDKKYVFHSNQLRGPKTQCSHAEVSTQDGISLLKRMIKLFSDLKRTDKVQELTAYLSSIENPTV